MAINKGFNIDLLIDKIGVLLDEKLAMGKPVSKITMNIKLELKGASGVAASKEGQIIYSKNAEGNWTLSSSEISAGQWGQAITIYQGIMTITSIVAE